MAKNIQTGLAALLNSQDVRAWYNKNIDPPARAEEFFPLVENIKSTTWKTVSNSAADVVVAADPISSKSKVPVEGREGFTTVMGEMVEFGKGYEWTPDDIEEYNRLQANFAQLQDQNAARALIEYYGNELEKIRGAHKAEMSALDWGLVSNACEYEFVAATSPYLKGLTAMAYPVSAWQKDAVGTSWADAAADILDDIQGILDTGDGQGKTYTVITLNKTWFNHVRANTQIKNQTITLLGSLTGADTRPSLAEINEMAAKYFDEEVRFEVISEKVTRSGIAGVRTTAVPFQDGVAVFSQSKVLGHFEYNKLPIIDPTKETHESFFLVGNELHVNPSKSDFYGKGRAFPVVDTYADNFYLKINAIAW